MIIHVLDNAVLHAHFSFLCIILRYVIYIYIYIYISRFVYYFKFVKHQISRMIHALEKKGLAYRRHCLFVSFGFYVISTLFQLFNEDSSQIHVSKTFQPILNQSIVLTLTGQSWCYSHDPERQGKKQLLPVLKNLVGRGRGLNPRPIPPVHEADDKAIRPLRRLSSSCIGPSKSPADYRLVKSLLSHDRLSLS